MKTIATCHLPLKFSSNMFTETNARAKLYLMQFKLIRFIPCISSQDFNRLPDQETEHSHRCSFHRLGV